jgi:hypothetical protein
MKKNYLLGYSLVALFLLFVSCSQEEEEIIPDSTNVNIEPDFFKNDGSIEESEFEEEVPVEGVIAKTYGYYNYTLLKPSDISQEKIDAMCGKTTTMPLLVGSRKMKVGEVNVRNDDENLYLTFSTDQRRYMKKVYLNIGAKGSTPFYSNGFPNLRKFNFKAFPYYYGGMKNATYVISLTDIDIDSFEIVAYTKVYDSYRRNFYSAFAYDQNLTQTYSYSYYSGCYYYNDWVRSFEYSKLKCQESAIAFGGGGKSTCFIDDGFDQWGWTSGPLNNDQRLQLFVNGSGCDQDNATFAGWVSVSYDNIAKVASVRFWTPGDSAYIFEETSLYIGSEKYPLESNGSETIDPSQYPYSHKNLGGVKTDITYVIENVPSDFYIIPHAMIYK